MNSWYRVWIFKAKDLIHSCFIRSITWDTRRICTALIMSLWVSLLLLCNRLFCGSNTSTYISFLYAFQMSSSHCSMESWEGYRAEGGSQLSRCSIARRSIVRAAYGWSGCCCCSSPGLLPAGHPWRGRNPSSTLSTLWPKPIVCDIEQLYWHLKNEKSEVEFSVVVVCERHLDQGCTHILGRHWSVHQHS